MALGWMHDTLTRQFLVKICAVGWIGTTLGGITRPPGNVPFEDLTTIAFLIILHRF